MGDYSDFYSPRRAHLRTVLKVTYKSGRVEQHTYNTHQLACDARLKFIAAGVVKRATILKKKVAP